MPDGSATLTLTLHRAIAEIDAAEIAATLGQDPGHELMGLFAASLNDLGRRVAVDHDGSFAAVADAAGSSAARPAP